MSVNTDDPRFQHAAGKLIYARFPQMKTALEAMAALLAEPVPDVGEEGREDWVAWREEAMASVMETFRLWLETMIEAANVCAECQERIRLTGDALLAEVCAGAGSS